MRTDGRPRKKSVSTTWQAIAYKCPTLYLEVAVKHTMNFTSCIVQECECYTCTNGTLKKRSASLIE